MNAPINSRNLKPLTPGAVALLVLQDVREAHMRGIEATTRSPIEADIAREETAALKARLATPWEVLQTLLLTKHESRRVNHEQWIAWLSEREWPDEQSETVHLPGHPQLLKLFKAADGFAVKWVPIEDGKRLATEKATYEVMTFTGKRP